MHILMNESSYENTAVKQDRNKIYPLFFCSWDLIPLWSLVIHTVFQHYQSSLAQYPGLEEQQTAYGL